MLLHRLAKLAQSSGDLRSKALEKRGMIGRLASGAKAIGTWASKNKGKAAIGGIGGVASISSAKGAFQEYKAGFNPAVQNARMGIPTPPGVE